MALHMREETCKGPTKAVACHMYPNSTFRCAYPSWGSLHQGSSEFLDGATRVERCTPTAHSASTLLTLSLLTTIPSLHLLCQPPCPFAQPIRETCGAGITISGRSSRDGCVWLEVIDESPRWHVLQRRHHARL